MNSRKKSFKMIAVLTLMCVCIAYFALLTPTTAYFYESLDWDQNLQFSLFDAQQTVLDTSASFTFKGATKFEDFDEILFDKVMYEKTVTVTNTGDVDARVYTKIGSMTGTGLHYIVFFNRADGGTNEGNSAADSNESVAKKGAVKNKIEESLYAYDNRFVSGISQADALSILDSYNASSPYTVLAKGESVDIQIVFWAEYGEIEGTIADTSSIKQIAYSAAISVIAAQNTDGVL